MIWTDYTADRPYHTVVGKLLLHERVWSPQLRNERAVYVWLPPDYERSARRYPVVYMHDGQNLFDEPISYAGEWRVDETMEQLSATGLPAIIVGVQNKGEDRFREYSPFHGGRFGRGRGDDYLLFLARTLKPLIDVEFRTLQRREHTGILGSSMGGLISLYGFARYANVFGFAGIMSPSLWVGHGAIFDVVAASSLVAGRIYLDAGGRETPSAARGGNMMLDDARRLNILLQQKGFVAGDTLLYREAAEATHSEAAWSERLPDALRFLLAGTNIPQGSGSLASGRERKTRTE